MPTIKAKKIPRKTLLPEDLLAKFCYHFPQYKFHEARKLPYKRIIQMLKIAQKEHAIKMLDLVQIVAAPHTNKGKGVSSLISAFQQILKD